MIPWQQQNKEHGGLSLLSFTVIKAERAKRAKQEVLGWQGVADLEKEGVQAVAAWAE